MSTKSMVPSNRNSSVPAWLYGAAHVISLFEAGRSGSAGCRMVVSRDRGNRPGDTQAERGMRSMKGSDLLVAALENEGVEQIFGVPGEENLDVVESLRSSRIKLIVTRHEQAAGFMAATHGRLTGKPGVCLATLGPGALNLTTGAAFALLGAMPMVMITGQKGILSRKQARFQVVDIVATMAPLI